jgi:hypothetical protein
MRHVLLASILVLCLAPRAAADPAEEPETTPLADRALRWVLERSDGAFRMRERGSRNWVRNQLVPLAERAVDGLPWPDAETLLAKAYWESRWRPAVIRPGSGEHGLVQLMPRYVGRYLREGESRADLLKPEVNLRVAAARLRDDWDSCAEDEARALTRYASSRCVIYRRNPDGSRRVVRPGIPERVVLNWAQQMRE